MCPVIQGNHAAGPGGGGTGGRCRGRWAGKAVRTSALTLPNCHLVVVRHGREFLNFWELLHVSYGEYFFVLDGILRFTQFSHSEMARNLLYSISEAMIPATNTSVAVRKATQALNYFAHLAASGSPHRELNKLKALKLLFFADRYHLRKYGRLVSDCAYFAMKNGPVASEAKHVAEDGGQLAPAEKRYARNFLRKKGAYDYLSVKDVDSGVLSKTDVEALNFAWGTFGHYSQFQLVGITHRYPEWKRHVASIRTGSRRIQMNYGDFFDEPDRGYNACHDLSSKDREIARELFLDSQATAQLWK